MLYRVIDASELPALVSAFMETYEVVAPVKRDQGYAFEAVQSPDDIELAYPTTMASPKKYFLPPEETLMSFDARTNRVTDFAAESGIDETLFKTILRKLDFSRAQFEKDMAGYSAGQKKKVLLARSLCQSAHLYVWDEPLNYIDLFSRIQLEQLILEYQPTMLLVEHDRSFLDAVATKIIHLERSETR